MLVSDAITDIRNKIDDTAADGDFSDSELISFLNEAITYISSYLITASNPLATKKTTVTAEALTVPSDFVKMAGTFPLRIVGNAFEFIDSTTTSVTIKYFANVPSVSKTTDSMPLSNGTFNIVAIRIAVNLALNQMKYNITQDQAITTELTNIINSSFGHAQ